jgi:PBSX family phage terminase large subunit
MESENQSNAPVLDVSLKSLIAPAFYDVHKAINRETFQEFWLKGGRCSTKSSFAAIELIRGMMQDPNANGIVFRKISDTIRGSVLQTCLWATEKLECDHLWRHTVSPAEMIYIPTGQKIIFKGLDKPTKIKSIKLKRGYFKFHWFEELEEFNGPEEIRNATQSVMRGGQSYIRLFTYNPPNDPQSWVNRESAVLKPNKYVHHSTYLDVPLDWLSETDRQEAEYLRETNLLAYQHEYLGLAVGIHESIIFAGKCVVKEFEPAPEWDGPYFGLDWGFSQDPLVLVKCWIEEIGDPRFPLALKYRLYIEKENYGVGVTIDQTPDFIEEIDGSKKYTIRADSARPEMINHLAGKGFPIVSVDKWKGSVEDGIAVLQNFVEIVIHTRCENMQEEARLYSYKIDRMTKLVTPDIIDKWNHGWDAVRYALAPMIKERMVGFTAEQVKQNERAERKTDAPRMNEKAW